MPSESTGGGHDGIKPPGKPDVHRPLEITKLPGEPEKERIIKPLDPHGDEITPELGTRVGEIGGQPEDLVRQDKQKEQLKYIPKLRIEAKSLPSDTHTKRNEDAFFKLPEKRLFGVFDGMGKHAAGDKASGIARDSTVESLLKLPERVSLDHAIGVLRNALVEAHENVSEQAKKDESNMGSTGTLGYIWGGEGQRKAIIASVGDSPAYLIRGGKLEQITIDDNLVKVYANGDAKLARAIQKKLSNVATTDDLERLTPYERFLYGKRSELTQALGHKNIIPNIYTIDLQPGDRLLIASDGITDNLTGKEIEKIVANSPNGKVAVEKLTEVARIRSRDKAHIRHKADDMTALFVEILPSEQEDAENKRRAYAAAFDQLVNEVQDGRDIYSINTNGSLRRIVHELIMTERKKQSYEISEEALKEAHRAAFEQLQEDVRSGGEKIGAITRAGELREVLRAALMAEKRQKQHSEKLKAEPERKGGLKKIISAAKENVSGLLYDFLGDKSPVFIRRHVPVFRFVEKQFAGMANEAGYSEWQIGGRGVEERRRATEWVHDHDVDPDEYVVIKSRLGELEKSGAVEFREWGGGLKKVVLKHRDPDKLIKHEVIKSNRDPVK